MLEGTVTDEFQNGLDFTDVHGQEWTFREVTIEEFRHKLCQNVGNGAAIGKLCTTTEDLWEYYRKLFPI